MQSCRVSLMELIDYQEGHADVIATQKIEQHLNQGCKTCHGRQTQLNRLLTALNGRELLEMPASVYARLQGAYRERYAPKSERAPLIARSIFDSRRGPQLVGARGAIATVDTFQMIHSTVEHDIHLWAEKQNARTWYMIGQVLPHAGGNSIAPEVAVLQTEGGPGLTAKADGDEFHLPMVTSGNYTLRLRLPLGEVIVPGIVVGA
jgi:hypothetical protein